MKPIVVVGSGVIGCVCALAINRFVNNRVVLIGSAYTEQAIDKTYALNRVSEALLESLGIWSQLSTHSYNSMTVKDIETASRFCYRAESLGENNLGHIVRERNLLLVCQKALEHNTQIDWKQQQLVHMETISDYRKLYIEDGSTLDASLVIAADGKNSPTCKMAGIKVEHKPTGDTSVVCDISLQKAHQNTAYQWFSHSGIVAFLPLGNNKQASLVWSVGKDKAKEVIGYSEDTFNEKLTQASLGYCGNVKRISDVTAFAVSQHQQEAYYNKALVCVGDAAHSVHPLAGQGLNMGLHDCLVLVQELVHAQNNKLSQNRALFHYQQKRQMTNCIDLVLMRTIQTSFRSANTCIQLLRKITLDIFHANRLAQYAAIKKALYGGMTAKELSVVIDELVNKKALIGN